MKVSAAGRALIERREGKRLSAYRDGRGIPTIGVGHTGRMSPPRVTAGMTITDAQCDAMLAADLAPVERTIGAAVRVPLSQGEFDALASLGFNIGAAGLGRSLTLRRLNGGDVAGAAAAFMDWAHPASLAGRRRDEMAQFLAARDPDVVADRAAVLAHRAVLRKASARNTSVGGGAVAALGAAASVAAPLAHHGHLAWWIGGLAAAGATADGLVAWTHHGAAKALAANAAQPAAQPVPPSTPNA